MGIRLFGSTSALNSIQDSSKKLQKIFSQLSSGKRINSAQDDPAGLALAQSLKAASSGISQANRNIATANNTLEVASGALNQTADQLLRLRDLALQAANGTTSDSDRAKLQAEFDQGVEQIDSIARDTEFNGTKLLDGSFDSSVQTGSEAGQSTSLSIGSASASSLGVSSAGISTQASAQDALDSIDNALAQVNSQRASIGASQNALEFRESANAVQQENLEEARSRAEDLDYADAVSRQNQEAILQKARVAAFSAGQNAQKAVFEGLFKK